MRILFIALLVLVSYLTKAQTTVKNFVNQYDDKRSFYLYQSTLRSFSDKTSESFNKLISDVEKISLHLLPQNVVELSAIINLVNAVEKDGFKEMGSISKSEEGIYFYKNDDKKAHIILGIFYKEGYAAVVQLDGEIDMKYVGALRELDPEKVGAFFGFDEMRKEYEKNKEKETEKEKDAE